MSPNSWRKLALGKVTWGKWGLHNDHHSFYWNLSGPGTSCKVSLISQAFPEERCWLFSEEKSKLQKGWEVCLGSHRKGETIAGWALTSSSLGICLGFIYQCQEKTFEDPQSQPCQTPSRERGFETGGNPGRLLSSGARCLPAGDES